MRITQEVSRKFAIVLESVERRFSVIEQIDSLSIKEKLDSYATLFSVADRARSAIDADQIGIFVETNGNFSGRPFPHNDWLESITEIEDMINSGEESEILISSLDTVLLDYEAHGQPRAKILFARRKGRGDFNKEEAYGYLISVFQRLTERMNENYFTQMSQRYQSLGQTFLRGVPRKESGTKSVEENGDIAEEEAWGTILESIAEALPSWGEVGTYHVQPKWQLLTVERGRQYWNLRAEYTAGAGGVEGGQVFSGRRLEAASTVSGIVLDRELAGHKDNYLSFSPKNDDSISNRYAAMLWSSEELPGSELVFPVYGKEGKIVAVVNVEHPDVGAFMDFQARQILREVESCQDFIISLIDAKRHVVDREKELRYLLYRIVHKISDQFSHRTKNEFAKLISSHFELAGHIADGKVDDALVELEFAKGIVEAVKKSTDGFNKRAQSFVVYGSKDIAEIVGDVISDARMAATATNYGIVIDYDRPTIHSKVFSSGLLSEHLYSVVQNSIENFTEDPRNRNRQDRKWIKVDISELPGEVDQRGKRLSAGVVQVSVADNGGGLRPEIAGREFHLGSTTKARGTGTGLAAARAYLRRLGGDVVVVNKPGSGVEVRLRIPMFDDSLHVGMAEELNLVDHDTKEMKA